MSDRNNDTELAALAGGNVLQFASEASSEFA
jgi:hypothetical protein